MSNSKQKWNYATVNAWDRDENEIKVKVHVGDYVSFKSDFEQSGEIIDIDGKGFGKELTLYREDGFGGEYLRYSKKAWVYEDDCWVEGVL